MDDLTTETTWIQVPNQRDGWSVYRDIRGTQWYMVSEDKPDRYWLYDQSGLHCLSDPPQPPEVTKSDLVLDIELFWELLGKK